MKKCGRLFSTALSLWVAAACGQESPTPPSSPDLNRRNEIQSSDTIHVRSSLVVMPVTVIDSKGNFVPDLSEDQFRVLDNRVPQRITQFGFAVEPVVSVIVIQANENVAPLLDQLHRLGPLFSDLLLGLSGQVAVITYGDRVEIAQNFSSDSKSLAKTLNHISTNVGKAHLNDALSRAISILARQTGGERRLIFVFSDGFDRGSTTTRAEIIQGANNINVAIYGLRFDPAQESVKRAAAVERERNGGGMDLLPLAKMVVDIGAAKVRSNLMQSYADFTGGTVYTHRKRHTLERDLQRIALDINSQYILAYVPSNLKEAGFHRIQVEMPATGLRVRTRSGYFVHSDRAIELPHQYTHPSN
jgi:VWFA-related protein